MVGEGVSPDEAGGQPAAGRAKAAACKELMICPLSDDSDAALVRRVSKIRTGLAAAKTARVLDRRQRC